MTKSKQSRLHSVIVQSMQMIPRVQTTTHLRYELANTVTKSSTANSVLRVIRSAHLSSAPGSNLPSSALTPPTYFLV